MDSAALHDVGLNIIAARTWQSSRALAYLQRMIIDRLLTLAVAMLLTPPPAAAPSSLSFDTMS
jgi:hypothetical protein